MKIRVAHAAQVADDLIEGAATWYRDNHVPAAFRDLHPAVVFSAAVLCGNDWQRCVAESDGSITVYNNRVWTPE